MIRTVVGFILPVVFAWLTIHSEARRERVAWMCCLLLIITIGITGK